MQNKVVLGNKYTVDFRYEHKGGANACVSVLVLDDLNPVIEFEVSKSCAKDLEKTKQIIQRNVKNVVRDFNDKDIDTMSEICCDMIRNEKPVDVLERLPFLDVCMAVYNEYDKKKSRLEEGIGENEVLPKTLTYTRMKDGEVYLCIPSNSMKVLFEELDTGWKPLEFKKCASRICDLWTGNGKTHIYEYQNIVAGEVWSVRIKMTAEIFGEEAVKKELDRLQKNDCKEVA